MKVYIVTEDSSCEYEHYNNIFVFENLEKAKAKKQELIEESGILEEVKNCDLICSNEDLYFEAYEDGEWDNNHYSIDIQEKEVE